MIRPSMVLRNKMESFAVELSIHIANETLCNYIFHLIQKLICNPFLQNISEFLQNSCIISGNYMLMK